MPDIAGLKLIVPTSATATGAGSSATVSATGKVTFTTAATVSINGCFTSTYDNYLIVVRYLMGVSAKDVDIRFRASGTDATGSNYTSQQLQARSTTVGGGRISSASIGYVGTGGTTNNNGTHIYVYGPNLAQPTAWRNVGVGGIDGASIDDYAGTHSLSTAYDGFTIYPDGASQNWTGALCIYGLSQ